SNSSSSSSSSSWVLETAFIEDLGSHTESEASENPLFKNRGRRLTSAEFIGENPVIAIRRSLYKLTSPYNYCLHRLRGEGDAFASFLDGQGPQGPLGGAPFGLGLLGGGPRGPLGALGALGGPLGAPPFKVGVLLPVTTDALLLGAAGLQPLEELLLLPRRPSAALALLQDLIQFHLQSEQEKGDNKGLVGEGEGEEEQILKQTAEKCEEEVLLLQQQQQELQQELQQQEEHQQQEQQQQDGLLSLPSEGAAAAACTAAELEEGKEESAAAAEGAAAAEDLGCTDTPEMTAEEAEAAAAAAAAAAELEASLAVKKQKLCTALRVLAQQRQQLRWGVCTAPMLQQEQQEQQEQEQQHRELLLSAAAANASPAAAARLQSRLLNLLEAVVGSFASSSTQQDSSSSRAAAAAVAAAMQQHGYLVASIGPLSAACADLEILRATSKSMENAAAAAAG
ncbi:hypothetical protein, conserved, partial [Eimeria brunetti]